jgi:hypothetical protein
MACSGSKHRCRHFVPQSTNITYAAMRPIDELLAQCVPVHAHCAPGTCNSQRNPCQHKWLHSFMLNSTVVELCPAATAHAAAQTWRPSLFPRPAQPRAPTQCCTRCPLCLLAVVSKTSQATATTVSLVQRQCTPLVPPLARAPPPPCAPLGPHDNADL